MYQAIHRAIEQLVSHVAKHAFAHLLQHGPDLVERASEKYDDWRLGSASSENKELSPEFRTFFDKYKAEQEEQTRKGE